ncbi:hypothetical protein DesLBE_3706 [Desulfitobacterium sp. LBE]|uniref:DUF5348 domain-containing protein n=1 Tax=Desulfitobacterium sp. LBE TaxID=884086 RepID=UPI0011997045|nr:DUF5348 domain-containing protein [Desulfitobacterium sp. LBE]TWH59331.1 hypothetical protein DesLBE_3706 [Desulfitobacterium sp. LBE]
MKRQWCSLKYDGEIDRWVAHRGKNCYGLHCGEGLEVCIGNHNIPCSLEYDDTWYVIMQDTRFNLRTQNTYKAKI